MQADEIYRTGVALRVQLALASYSLLSLIYPVAFRSLARGRRRLNLISGRATRTTYNHALTAPLVTSMDGCACIRSRTRNLTQITHGILRMAPHLVMHTVAIGEAIQIMMYTRELTSPLYQREHSFATSTHNH